MKPRRIASWFGSTLVVASIVASCRDFSDSADVGGSEQTGGAGSPAGGAPADTSAGDTGNAVSHGAIAGADGDVGAAGSGAGYEHADHAAAGAGGSPAASPSSNDFGAVRLFIDGLALCGGTLLNNAWVLTADSCIPSDEPEMLIAFGSDSSNPIQTERVAEVVRFPGNDGTAVSRGRNLALLRAENAFMMASSREDYHQPLWFLRGEVLASTERCAGWSFSPGAVQDSSMLRVLDLTPFRLESDQKYGLREAGDWIWWARTALKGTDTFVLPTAAEIGSGCFYNVNQLRLLMSVHSHIPAQRLGGQANLQMESVSTAVAEPAVRAWVERNMMAEPDYLPFPPLGPVASAWSPRRTAYDRPDGELLDVLGVSLDSGDLLWFTQRGDWAPPENLGAPSEATLSKTLRPAMLIRRFGEAEFFAVATDGTLWWKRRFRSSSSGTDWRKVDIATTAVTSGVHVAERIPGHFYLVARGARGELRYAEYEDKWLKWTDVGGQIVGEPAIDVPQEGRINVFFTNPAGQVEQYYPLGDTWYSLQVPSVGPLNSSPVLGHWSLDHFDFLGRLPNGNMGRHIYMGGWGTEWLDLGVPIPAGEPTMALRSPGHGDLFVSEVNGDVWHVAWPRTQ